MTVLPRCETCGQPCKRHHRVKGQRTRFCSQACVPRALRVTGGHEGRRLYAYRIRAEKFRAEIAQFEGKRITTEALFEVFCRIERKGYMSGFRAGRCGSRPAIHHEALSA